MHLIRLQKYPIISLLLLVSFAFGLGQGTSAQTKTPETANTLKELLDLPSPPPLSAFINGTPVERYEEIWNFENVDPNKPPADDAPIIDLVRFWLRRNPTNDLQPTDQVRSRLFEAFLDQPELLSQLLLFAPINDSTLEKCKRLYDKARAEQPEGVLSYSLKFFLLYRSRYFLDELIELADRKVDGTRYKGPNLDAIKALANVDWNAAQPLVMNLLNSDDEGSSFLAVSLLYLNAQKSGDSQNEEKYRKILLEVAANRSTQLTMRDSAIFILSTGEWSGRDEWYLSLFHDESLLEGEHLSQSPMVGMYLKDPDKWLPVLLKMVAGKDKIVRSNAARCLLPTYLRPAKSEVMKSLLPWLSDPDWVISKGSHRLSFILSLESVDLPESVPGLMWIVEHDKEASHRSRAAAALARYADPRAIPMLRKALAEETEYVNRQGLIKGLLGSKGLTDEEQLAALESFVQTKNGTDESEANIYTGKTVPIELAIGAYLNSGGNASISLGRLALNRAETLKKTNPKLSSALIETVHRWSGKHVDLDIVSRIADVTLSTQTLQEILQRRVKFRENVRPELEALAATKGAAPAIAAVLLDDATLAQSVLSAKDEMAHIALLVTARLTRMPLPPSEIEPFLNSKNSLLVLAAERYLLAQDTTESRQMLWRNRPDQAFIAGWRDSYGTEPFAELESKLQKELLSDKSLVDIVAVIGYNPLFSIVRIYQDKATLQVATDRARFSERELSTVELKAIRDSFEAVGFMDLGAQVSYCHHGCPNVELLTLTRNKGRRVFIQTGDQSPVTTLFAKLRGEGKFKISYLSKSNLPDLEILYDADAPTVRDVVLDGKVVKVQVEREFTPEEEKQAQEEYEKSESGEIDDDDYSKFNLWEKNRDATRFSWRILKDGVLAEEIATPASHVSPLELKARELEDFDSSNWRISASPNSFVYATEEHLIKVGPGQRETQLGQGAYSYPVITADGKWIVAAKEEGDDEELNPVFLVRINATTGKQYRIGIPEADEIKPMFFVPFRNQILARRSRQYWSDKQIGPASPEYYLVDPVTGRSQLIKGNFEPLEQIEKRFFQSSSRPEEYWLAISPGEKDETQIGLYSFKDFSFRSVLTIPKLKFNSMNMWIDEAGNKAYVAYKGQLLRFSLRPGDK